MVLCIVVGCGRKKQQTQGKIQHNTKDHPKSMHEMAGIDPGEKKLLEFGNCGDTEEKNILESQQVCDRHFVSGKPTATWDMHNVNWVLR